MDYRANENDDEEYGGGNKKKKSSMFRAFKMIVYSVSIIVIVVTIYRVVSIGMPSELKNYLVGSQRIEQAHASQNDDFVMYSLGIRNAFGRGDAFFVDNVYYLESAETLQLTLRCKTSRFPVLFGSSGEPVLAQPFEAYLKISETSGGDELDYIVLETSDEVKFGKNNDRYVYFVYSFEDVAIDYANSKLELYVFDNASAAAAPFDEDRCLARFTLFDINMPKTKVQLKKFTIR